MCVELKLHLPLPPVSLPLLFPGSTPCWVECTFCLILVFVCASVRSYFLHKVLIVLPYCLTFNLNCLINCNFMNFSFRIYNLLITISWLLFLLHGMTLHNELTCSLCYATFWHWPVLHAVINLCFHIVECDFSILFSQGVWQWRRWPPLSAEEVRINPQRQSHYYFVLFCDILTWCQTSEKHSKVSTSQWKNVLQLNVSVAVEFT